MVYIQNDLTWFMPHYFLYLTNYVSNTSNLIVISPRGQRRKQAEEQKGHNTNLEPHFSLHPAYILSICTAFSIS